MKKYLFTLALALSATFFGFAADCSVVAEVVVSSFEDKYGCLDSDSYNDFIIPYILDVWSYSRKNKNNSK